MLASCDCAWLDGASSDANADADATALRGGGVFAKERSESETAIFAEAAGLAGRWRGGSGGGGAGCDAVAMTMDPGRGEAAGARAPPMAPHAREKHKAVATAPPAMIARRRKRGTLCALAFAIEFAPSAARKVLRASDGGCHRRSRSIPLTMPEECGDSVGSELRFPEVPEESPLGHRASRASTRPSPVVRRHPRTTRRRSRRLRWTQSASSGTCRSPRPQRCHRQA